MISVETHDIPCPLSSQQQDIVAEFHIVNGFILSQLVMPMVCQGDGGEFVRRFFHDTISAMYKGIIQSGLLSEELKAKRKDILDEANGINPNLELSYAELYRLAFDVEYLLRQHLATMGLPMFACPPKDEYYDDDEYFRRREWPSPY